MKKLVFSGMVLASVFLLAGCSDSPRQTALKWANAIAEGEGKKAAEYSTERTVPLNVAFIAEIHLDEEDLKRFKDYIKEDLEKGEEIIDGDIAYIGSSFRNKGNKKLKLKKIDGKWKVDITE